MGSFEAQKEEKNEICGFRSFQSKKCSISKNQVLVFLICFSHLSEAIFEN